jgi:hypothetical protein
MIKDAEYGKKISWCYTATNRNSRTKRRRFYEKTKRQNVKNNIKKGVYE